MRRRSSLTKPCVLVERSTRAARSPSSQAVVTKPSLAFSANDRSTRVDSRVGWLPELRERDGVREAMSPTSRARVLSSQESQQSADRSRRTRLVSAFVCGRDGDARRVCYYMSVGVHAHRCRSRRFDAKQLATSFPVESQSWRVRRHEHVCCLPAAAGQQRYRCQPQLIVSSFAREVQLYDSADCHPRRNSPPASPSPQADSVPHCMRAPPNPLRMQETTADQQNPRLRPGHPLARS